MREVTVILALVAVGSLWLPTVAAPNAEANQSRVAAPIRTLLHANTIYYYRSAFPEFRTRLGWIANTDRPSLLKAANETRKSQSTAKDWALALWSGNPLQFWIVASGKTRSSDGERKLPWWADPVGAVTEAPLRNFYERTLRSLPKLEEDGCWGLQAVEDLEFAAGDPAKEIFAAAADYDARGPEKTSRVQPQSRVVAHSTAVVFRESDKSVLFINGIKWNHPLYSQGYTEFHLHVSQVTGAIISDSYAYTTFPLEPGEWSQYSTMTRTAVDAIKTAGMLMSPQQ